MTTMRQANINGRVTRWLMTAAAIVILLLALWVIRDVILVTLAALLLAILLDFPIRMLVKIGLARRTATTIVLLVFGVTLVVLSVIAVPVIAQQVDTFVNDTVPRLADEISAWTTANVPVVEEIAEQTEQAAEEADMPQSVTVFSSLVSQLGGVLDRMVEAVPNFFSGLLSTVVSFLIVVFLVMFVLSEPHVYRQGALLLLPRTYHHRAKTILEEIDNQVRAWMQAMSISIVVMGFGVWLGLTLIGLPQALLISIIAAITSFIPNFGPIIALVPALIVALTESQVNPLWVVVVIYGMTFLQNQLLLPWMLGRRIYLPAAMVLLAQIVFGVFFGFLGLLLAVPIAIILTVLVREVYVRDMLGHDLEAGSTSA